MTLDEVYNHFGSWYQVIKQCRFSEGTPRLWKRKGYIPEYSQLRLEHFTAGVLKFRQEDLQDVTQR